MPLEPLRQPEIRPEVRQIPDWADRVIQGQVRIPGEAANRESIERHVNILAPGSLFLLAIDALIQEHNLVIENGFQRIARIRQRIAEIHQRLAEF